MEVGQVTEMLAQLAAEFPVLWALAYPVALLFWLAVAAAPVLLLGMLFVKAFK